MKSPPKKRHESDKNVRPAGFRIEMNIAEGLTPLPSNLEHISSVESSVMSVSSITSSVNSPEHRPRGLRSLPKNEESKFKPAESRIKKMELSKEGKAGEDKAESFKL